MDGLFSDLFVYPPFQNNFLSYTTTYVDSCREDQDVPELVQIRWIRTVNTQRAQVKSKSGKTCEVAPGRDLISLVERRNLREVTLRRWSCVRPQPCHMGDLPMQVGITPTGLHFQGECSRQEV